MKKMILFFLCIILLFGCTKPRQIRYDLVQLTVKGTAEGTFFLLGGSIGTDYYFTFYTKDNNGCILLQHVHYKQVRIYEDGQSYAICRIDYLNQIYYKEWEIHVPKNSIYNKVDLELK